MSMKRTSQVTSATILTLSSLTGLLLSAFVFLRRRLYSLVLAVVAAVGVLLVGCEGLPREGAVTSEQKGETPHGEAEALLKQGNEFATKANPAFDEAIRCYRKAVELRPDFQQAWLSMGVAYRHKGDPDEAFRCYRKAVELEREFAEAWNNMGIAYRDKGDFDEATRCYRKAVQFKPYLYQSWYNLACIYGRRGDAQGAVANLRKATKLDSDCREEARGDKDFDSVRSNPDFKALMGEGK